jgi:tetratricopeptide (TPR) repeat protein
MRFCRSGYFGLLALALVGCATTPHGPGSSPGTPVAPTSQAPELAGYRSAADAPKVLDAFDQRFAKGQSTPSDLSTPDLQVYSNLLLAAGRLPEADKLFQLLNQRVPKDKTTLLTLALVAGARGDRAAQTQRLAALEAAFPGDLDAAGIRARLLLAQGNRTAAAAEWKAILAQKDDLDALVGLTDLSLDANKPQDALAWAERAVRAFPLADEAWAARARVKTDLAQYLPARQDLDRAITLSPDDPWHRLDRGKLAWLHLYDPVSARADLEYSVAKQPNNFFAWAALGEVYDDQNQPRKSYDAWMKALSVRPDYRFGYTTAAMLAFRYLDFDRAIRYAHEAAKDYPAEYAFPFVEALSLRAIGQPQAAQTVLEKARPRFERGSTVDEMFRFLLTPGSDYYLNNAMKLETKDTVRLRLRFYQGAAYALAHAANSARAALQEVADSTLQKIPEIGAARDWLEHGP